MDSLKTLLGTSRSSVLPSIADFATVDIDSLKKRLKLVDRAREQGLKDLPASASDTLDPVEQEIISEIEKIAREQHDLYQQHQKAYSDRAADANVQSLAVDLLSISSSAQSSFQRETQVGVSELYARKRAVIHTERAYNEFRLEHDRRRPPRDYGSKSLKIAFLALLLAIEAVLNGFFLAKGSEFGLVGGVFEAILIAGINIAVGVSIGRFIWPWFSYKSAIAKLGAGIATLVYLIAALGFNLAVAHYRTAMSGDPFEASAIAYGRLIAGPFSIEDLQSWALVILGGIFSLGAAYDGLRMDDPYPGYGHRYRQNLGALSDYSQLKDQLLSQLDEIRSEAEAKIADISRSIAVRQSEFANVGVRSASLRVQMLEYFDHLQGSANALLSFYRNENQKHRTAPAPARFTNGAKWVYGIPDISEVAAGSEQRASIAKAVKKALNALPDRQEALQQGYRSALSEYRRIDDLVDEGGAP